MSLNSKIFVHSLAKSYDDKNWIFRDLDFEVRSGQAIAITGNNGSGKTTLLQTIAGVISPSIGNAEFYSSNKKINKKFLPAICGFVAPYLNVYEEFNPIELSKIISGFRGTEFNLLRTKELLRYFGLGKRMLDPVSSFSSGMKQRVKFMIAFSHDPEFIFLDEPASNLDEQGIEAIYDLILDSKKNNKVVLIATNENRDIKLTDSEISLKIKE